MKWILIYKNPEKVEIVESDSILNAVASRTNEASPIMIMTNESLGNNIDAGTSDILKMIDGPNKIHVIGKLLSGSLSHDDYPNIAAVADASNSKVVDDTLPISNPVITCINTSDNTYTISISADENTTIYYTIDGSDPSDGIEYTSDFQVEGVDTTIKAVAVDASGSTSRIVEYKVGDN